MMNKQCCSWVTNDEIYQNYHDEEWGRPVYDSQDLFAKLCLDGQQAGLSWLTILKRRDNYYRAFHQFDPDKIALMTDDDVDRLMLDTGIIRSRQKICAIIKNAKSYLKISEKQEFSDFIWAFVDHRTITNTFASSDEIPTSTEASKAMAKALKKEGFSYVGETICYAFMQAVGMVNDHTLDCHCFAQCQQLSRK